MADLNLQGYRQKAIPQVPLNINLVSSGTEYDDATDTTIEYIQLENQAPLPATITITTDVSTTLGSNIITGNFSSYNLRIGDGIAGSGIAFGSKIAGILNSTTISLDQTCTETNTTQDVIITPPTFNANIFAITKTFSVSGSTLSMRVKLLRADGLVNTDTNGDGLDSSSYLDYPTYIDQIIQIDLDKYLSNLRVERP